MPHVPWNGTQRDAVKGGGPLIWYAATMRRTEQGPDETLGATGLPVGVGAPAGWPRIVRGAGRFLIDWFPLLVVLFLYDSIHNRLARFLPPAHTLPQIRADEMLFGGNVPAVQLQRIGYSQTHPGWWDYAALAVYTSHFFVPILVGLWLWVRSRPRYLQYMRGVVGLTTIGYLTYILFPAVPPWLASQRGALAPTHRLVRELWEHLGFHGIAVQFSGSTLYANDVAAIPSLHAAYPLLIAVFFWRDGGPVRRVALALYAAVMALVLVYAAEHYVLDIGLGWLYAIVTVAAIARFDRAPRGVDPAAATRRASPGSGAAPAA